MDTCSRIWFRIRIPSAPLVKQSEPDIHFEIECCLLKYIILHRVLEMDGFAVTFVWTQVVIWDTYSISPIKWSRASQILWRWCVVRCEIYGFERKAQMDNYCYAVMPALSHNVFINIKLHHMLELYGFAMTLIPVGSRIGFGIRIPSA